MKRISSVVIFFLILTAAQMSAVSEVLGEKSVKPANWALSEIGMKGVWPFIKKLENRKKITVGIVDTGVASSIDSFSHLKITEWSSEKTVTTNDTHGHGTHILGIIAGKPNSNARTTGIAPHIVDVISYKYYAPTFTHDNLYNSNLALKKVLEDKPRVVNYSGGGANFDEEEKKLIEAAGLNGTIMVVAAGNGEDYFDREQGIFSTKGIDLDLAPRNKKYYPCAYNLDNIICVGSFSRDQKIHKVSNYSSELVHVFAPGKDIVSNNIFGQYHSMSGTSQATAFVSGAVAILLYYKPELTPLEVKNLVMNSSDEKDFLVGKATSSGTLNIKKLLDYSDSTEMRKFDYEVSRKIASAKRKKNIEKRLSPAELLNQEKQMTKSLIPKQIED